MLLVLALSLLMPSGDPPVKLKISNDMFMRGDRARVYVKSTRPGYLLVLRADAQGRVRVLFPQAPDDDTYIPAGKQLEVRGRGDRDAFTVDDAGGSGKIIAAVSPRPFNTAQYSRGGHWDYWALSLVDTAGVDTEALLLSIADGMSAPGEKYEYDLVTYTVASEGELGGYGYAHPRVHIGIYGGWGYGPPLGAWGWRPWYGPVPVRCWGCRW
jgi:uncharacterized protein DUF4384